MVGTLIHPHEASNLPGYRGYTPQLKFQCGHTYGYQTDKLSTVYTQNDKLRHTLPVKEKMVHLPLTGMEDQKYVKQMVPGYTGFVPQHFFKYGQTYAEGTEDAVVQSKLNYHAEEQRHQELCQTVRSRVPLAPKDNAPPDNSHPGVNMRYVYSYNGKKFDDKRKFTEAPIPGYQGYVPTKEEHILGEKYNIWTRHAYNHAAQNLASTQMQKGTQQLPTTNTVRTPQSPTWPPKNIANNRFGSLYSQRLGMIPNYTGFVPQHRFDFGTTYGDSTRSMPVCEDTYGYSLGNYNDATKPITPTVIPVRI